jgi:hypothetical protein
VNWEPGDPHEPAPHRRATGWLRWWASCPCGWIFDGGGKLTTMAAIGEHLAGGPRECDCYDSDAMEYGPPCSCGQGE